MELREKRNVPQQDREFSVSSVPDTDISFGLEASVVFVIEDIDQVNFNSCGIINFKGAENLKKNKYLLC